MKTELDVNEMSVMVSLKVTKNLEKGIRTKHDAAYNGPESVLVLPTFPCILIVIKHTQSSDISKGCCHKS